VRLKHHSCTTHAPLMHPLMHHSSTTHAPLKHHSCTTHAPLKHHSSTTQAPLKHYSSTHSCTTHAPTHAPLMHSLTHPLLHTHFYIPTVPFLIRALRSDWGKCTDDQQTCAKNCMDGGWSCLTAGGGGACFPSYRVGKQGKQYDDVGSCENACK
jgi:hypothetical protein